MSQEMASLASKIITAVACMAGYTDEPIPSDYSPLPIMEIHGLIDPLLLYGSSSTASIQVVGTLEGDEGAIQNMYHWAEANNCPSLTRMSRLLIGIIQSKNLLIVQITQRLFYSQ